MADDLIGSDSGLDEAERRTLDLVTDMIIPASADRARPSARDVGVLNYIRDHEPDTLPRIVHDLHHLDATAREHHAVAFADLDAGPRQELVDALRAEDAGFLRVLAVHTVTCYYQDDRVLEAIGLEPRPPFPKGYDVPSGDLTLLAPVKARGKLVRDA